METLIQEKNRLRVCCQLHLQGLLGALLPVSENVPLVRMNEQSRLETATTHDALNTTLAIIALKM